MVDNSVAGLGNREDNLVDWDTLVAEWEEHIHLYEKNNFKTYNTTKGKELRLIILITLIYMHTKSNKERNLIYVRLK